MTQTETAATPTTRHCPRCDTTKPAADFWTTQESCIECHRAWRAARANAHMDTMRELTFGVEIECGGKSRSVVSAAVISVVGGTVHRTGNVTYDTHEITDAKGRTWLVMADSSLSGFSKSVQTEVVTPVLKYADLDELQEVVRAVRKCGVRVDQYCGIHIHVGTERASNRQATALTPRACGNLLRLNATNADIIRKAVGTLDSREQYAGRLSSCLADRATGRAISSWDSLMRLWYGVISDYGTARPDGRISTDAARSRARFHYDGSRYHGLNLHSVFFRGTVEFRWFNGTLHAGKIRAYVQFCLAMAAKANTLRAATWTRPRTTERKEMISLLRWLGLQGAEFKTCRLHMLVAWDGEPSARRRRSNGGA